ncbi:virulence factor Mce family protein [Nocardia amikacinitolerans]|uniref:MCE family protein n=1 Tax=Nocardia amikacinitolerans TaxID=756689 RepID=UPI000A035C23|nr:MlaD family protein [Nocardia amikacinitolerans]MCP2319999.1 virulence factor Mce family protein [Nocardia amikacinitolerans]
MSAPRPPRSETLLDLAGLGLDLGASILVGVAEWARRRAQALATLGMIGLLLVGGGYLALDVVRYHPLRETYRVRVQLAETGGLLPNSDVTFRGVRVGTVRAVELSPHGVEAIAEIDAGVRVPAGGEVAVQRLSAAGEQYLDFRPDSNGEPYLEDGALIGADRVSTPVTINSFLTNTSALIAGLNPQRLNVIIDELDRALADGPDRLRTVISGISQAMAGLTAQLPQTERLIANLSVIAETTSHAQPDLTTLVRGSGVLFGQLSAADQEVRRLLELGPGQLATLGGVIAETGDPITDLVTNFVAITRAARLRTPAMTALFPALRAGSAAMGVPAHDNAFHTLMDIWPRPTCEYETIPVSPAQVGDGRVRLYNYCVTGNPALQVRGSANAPRPDLADNGSGPPPGATGDELSVPLPAK